MFCKKCGKEIQDDVLYCPECGANQYSNINHQRTNNIKSAYLAGLLNILIAGVGRMYLGYISLGIAQLLVSIFTGGLGSIWSLIDGITMFTGSVSTDADGNPLKQEF